MSRRDERVACRAGGLRGDPHVAIAPRDDVALLMHEQTSRRDERVACRAGGLRGDSHVAIAPRNDDYTSRHCEAGYARRGNLKTNARKDEVLHT